jgi:hypothetical protein
MERLFILALGDKNTRDKSLETNPLAAKKEIFERVDNGRELKQKGCDESI